MLVPFVIGIYRYPMIWWFIVPLIAITLLVAFLVFESRLPKYLQRKKIRIKNL